MSTTPGKPQWGLYEPESSWEGSRKKAWESRPRSSRQIWRQAEVRRDFRDWSRQGTGLERHWMVPGSRSRKQA